MNQSKTYLERSWYKFDEAIRYLAGLAAWYRAVDPPQGQLFEDGGGIAHWGIATEAPFADNAEGFSDALAELKKLRGLEKWVCLAVWRDGGRIDDAAKRLRCEESQAWACFYAGTEQVLWELTHQPGVKHSFAIWREGRHNRRFAEGI